MSQYITCKDLTIISASEHEQEVVDTYIMKKKSRRGTKKSRSGCVTCKYEIHTIRILGTNMPLAGSEESNAMREDRRV